MTDNEIIKALECCIEDEDCSHCPSTKEMPYCSNDIMAGALNLIKRQQAEIERLGELLRIKAEGENILNDVIAEQQAELEDLREIVFMDRTEEIKKKNKELKSEAVKEFGDKLKNKIKIECNPYGKPTFDYDTSIAIMRYIDNLVTEMVGEEL